MTVYEYKDKINGLVSNPDTAATEALSLIDEITKDLGELGAAKTSVSELQAKVADLQDTNMKLYMNIAGGSSDDEPEDEPAEGPAVIDEFMDMLFKEEGDE